MDEQNRGFYVAETATVLYLTAPLLIFFASFTRPELALLGCGLILFLIYEMVRQTHGIRWLVPDWQSMSLLLIAAAWVWLSGGIGPVHQNQDWYKHHQIVTLLTQNEWPVVVDLADRGESALRYYIGWYLVPSMMLKLIGTSLQVYLIFAWSVLGIFILFTLLRDIAPSRWGIVGLALAFVVFGGADLIGTHLTKFAVAEKYHFEWWVGWIQYSSNTTALFWVPQHALPAWLGIALLMRFWRREALIPYLGVLMSAILLWSPFSAIGLVPFVLVLVLRNDIRKVLANVRLVASALLLAVPVGMYLIADASEIPHGFIGTIPCIGTWPCFTWGSYALFLVIEIGLAVGLLLLRRDIDRDILLTAGVALCLAPLYKMGLLNDFAMRVSLPSLALLGIFCAKALVCGPRSHSILAAVILLLALPTALGEMARGFLPVNADVTPTAIVPPGNRLDHALVVDQYFAPLPVWVLKKSENMSLVRKPDPRSAARDRHPN